MICVWDLLTGACLYSILAHDGAVLSLAHSPSYVISLGEDDKVCVWERCQGHLINSLSLVRSAQLFFLFIRGKQTAFSGRAASPGAATW